MKSLEVWRLVKLHVSVSRCHGYECQMISPWNIALQSDRLHHTFHLSLSWLIHVNTNLNHKYEICSLIFWKKIEQTRRKKVPFTIFKLTPNKVETILFFYSQQIIFKRVQRRIRCALSCRYDLPYICLERVLLYSLSLNLQTDRKLHFLSFLPSHACLTTEIKPITASHKIIMLLQGNMAAACSLWFHLAPDLHCNEHSGQSIIHCSFTCKKKRERDKKKNRSAHG